MSSTNLICVLAYAAVVLGEVKTKVCYFSLNKKRNVTNFSPLERVRVTRANNQLLFDLDSGVVGTVTIKICIHMHCIWDLMIN